MGSSILGSLSPSLLGVEDDKSRTEDCQSVGERGCLAGPLYFIRMQLEPYGWQPPCLTSYMLRRNLLSVR